ncbi:DUF6415 family natural product biosynthesis protein [Streptomyces adelaidensis]|jgi:hypothetical protein|uniref:DUF6415 family natural product biosynthesis protein n=1 Tax=Streptomyces adelaidensis TaxID=2796465 RepID=UPI00190511E6|nr:DUF6415 family natural product biosynthesis protein [Streptomyces adelaidensis]
MSTRTDCPPATGELVHIPLDTETMRAAARRLLAEDAESPAPDELEILTLQLRGHIMVALPEVEAAAGRLPEGDVPRACALACVGEARMRLGLDPGPHTPRRHRARPAPRPLGERLVRPPREPGAACARYWGRRLWRRFASPSARGA